MVKRRREGVVSDADKALKSPRPNVGGKSLASLGLEGVQPLTALPPDSSDSSEETTSSGGSSGDSAGDSGRCPHMRLDAEAIDIVIWGIQESDEPPTCQHRGCRITWRGAGRNKEGMMRCIDCRYVSCAAGVVREDPRGHALIHALRTEHYVAQWYDEPNLGYCFKCVILMRLSDNPDLMSEEVKDVQGMVASKSVVASKPKDDWRIVVSSSAKVDRPMVASSSMAHMETLAKTALDQWGLNDVGDCAMGNGYVVRRMPNPYSSTCYMNASLQCLFALGKLRAMIQGPDARLGCIGQDLKQLFVETSSLNNARLELDPNVILVYLQSLHQDLFQDRKMEDSHEFLTSLFDALDNEVDQINESGPGGEKLPTFNDALFRGQLMQTISCERCSHISVMHQPLNGLQLSVPSKEPPARSKPLQVDSTEVKDVVQSRMQNQKNDNIEVPIALDSIPKLFDDSEEMKESATDSHNTEDKGKAWGSAIPHDKAKHINTLGSIDDCLEFFFRDALVTCPKCSKVAKLPETSGIKIVEPIMASINVNTTVGVDQTELSDRKTCSNEKDLASCSRANEKAESHEGVQKAAPSCLPTGKLSDLLSSQDIQDTSTQKQDSGKHVLDDHSARRVEETQNEQTDDNDSAIQTQLISKLPPVLIIQLKKYAPDLSKMRGHVRFEEILQLGPFMDHSCNDKDNSSYRLVGVIVHFGEALNSGHYIAYVRGGGSSWVCANDLNISVVSLEQVLGCEAYILFYERMEGSCMSGIPPTN